jgi:UDP-glucose 4-epimerase
MNVLVTGGAGFIGSHVVEFLHADHEVRVLDDFRTGRVENLQGFDVEVNTGSIGDPDALSAAMKGVDVVFHMAAFVSVPESIKNPQLCNKINTLGTLNVLQAAREAEVNKLVFASSAAVYGDTETSPVPEQNPLQPKSPYAVTKLDGELYCDLWRNEGWVDTVCCRFFNVFGERQDVRSSYGAAVPSFCESAKQGKSIHIFGDGAQTRDFVYVRDVVDAMVQLSQTPETAGVYNVGYGTGIRVSALAQTIKKYLNSQSDIVFDPPRPGDIRHSVASNVLLRSTGWKPNFGFEDGLKHMLQRLET